MYRGVLRTVNNFGSQEELGVKTVGVNCVPEMC